MVGADEVVYIGLAFFHIETRHLPTAFALTVTGSLFSLIDSDNTALKSWTSSVVNH